MRIVFAGTPEFAAPALQTLAAAGHTIAAVYTQPDRPAGRGRKLTASPIKQTAQRLGIPVEQPQTLRTETAAQHLARCAPDVTIVVAYGLLLPPAILAIPKYGCINIHASLLPRWRGAAPIQRAIIAGDRETGISIMQMEAGLDTGPVYLQRSIQIASDDTGGSLHDKLAALGASAIVDVLKTIESGKVQARPQDDTGVTYANKLEKSEALIDWQLPAADIERRVRAFNPWPVAETRWRDKQLRIWAAHVVEESLTPALSRKERGQEQEPGTVLSETNEGIIVACGQDALSLDIVQSPGGRQQTAASFLHSHRIQNVRLG